LSVGSRLEPQHLECLHHSFKYLVSERINEHNDYFVLF
jgi:hypothetical protein